MSQHFLYSTNVFLKQFIQQNYAGDVHYVWCSEVFDAKSLGIYAPGAMVAPTSNPADIYRELAAAVARGDTHSPKIAEQRAAFTKRAIHWHKARAITDAQRADLLYQIKHADMRMWRPLLYVIPRALVTARMVPVVASKRAHPAGPEFTVADLKRDEFDLVEL